MLTVIMFTDKVLTEELSYLRLVIICRQKLRLQLS